MALIVSSAGREQLLKMALQKASVENQTLKLYVNDYTPVEGSVAGSFTEMSTHSYSAKTLTRSNWSASTSSGLTTIEQPLQSWDTFASSASTTVYGYFIIETTSGILLWAERFMSPKIVTDSADVIRITPKVTLRIAA